MCVVCAKPSTVGIFDVCFTRHHQPTSYRNNGDGEGGAVWFIINGVGGVS